MDTTLNPLPRPQSLLVPPLRGDARAEAFDAIAKTRLGAVDVAAVLVYDFDHVSSSALLHLGEQQALLGDAGWDFAGFGPATDAKRRALLKESIALHRIKGTAYAMRRAASLLAVRASIKEWHQQMPPGKPYTHQVNLYLTDAPVGQPVLTPERVEAAIRMARYWKPARSGSWIRVGVGLSPSPTRSALVARTGSHRAAHLWPSNRFAIPAHTRSAVTLRTLERRHLLLLPT